MERKKKIMEMQEQQRRLKEEQMREKIAKLETKRAERERRIQESVEQKRQKDSQRLEAFRKVHRSLQREHMLMSEKYLPKIGEGSKQLGSRKLSASVESSASERLKAVQEEVKKRLEEKRETVERKMKDFEERMKRKEAVAEEHREERKEQAREWSQTLNLNIGKKKRKERYRRELMERKMQTIEEKQKLFEERKDLMRKERFYAKINDEMKSHYVKEALHEMALKKNWSLQRIDGIMQTFQPNIPEGPLKDKKVIENNINKVLADPFHSASKSKMSVAAKKN